MGKNSGNQGRGRDPSSGHASSRRFTAVRCDGVAQFGEQPLGFRLGAMRVVGASS